jgi:hypothetical protein
MASYDVEEILDSRKKGKNTEYLVRWSPTWESEKNLNCNKLIKEFKAKTGADQKDNANGEVDDEQEEEEESPETSTANKRSGRKAAKAGDRKRKAAQKITTKKPKSKRRK